MKIVDTSEENGEVTLTCTVGDLKRIYKGLFAQLKTAEGKLEDEGDLALGLQQFLQRKAFKLGVDVTRHSEWEKWLGNPNPTPCEVRYAAYAKNQ